MARGQERDGIRKLGPKHYRVAIELPKTADGKRRREHKNVHGTREEAKAVRAAMLDAKARGQYVGRSDQRLGEYLESWLAWKQPRVSPRTWERYDSLLRGSVIPKLGGLKLQDLTAQHLDDYYAASLREKRPRKQVDPKKRSHKRKLKEGEEKPRPRRAETLSPTTVHHRHVVLKMALKRAVELDLLARNPADYTQPPRPKRPSLKVLDESESGRLLDLVAGTQVEMPVYLALMTGARLGEILGLRWCDIDLRDRMMYVRQTLVEPLKRPSGADWFSFKEPKSGKGRAVDLDETTVELLKHHRKEQAAHRLRLGVAWRDLDLVLASASGEPLRPSTVSTRFREITQRGGLDGLRFHDLRHTHASVMLRAGQPPHVVSKRLGHASVGFTLDVYASVLPGQQRQAAEAFAAAITGARKAACG